MQKNRIYPKDPNDNFEEYLESQASMSKEQAGRVAGEAFLENALLAVNLKDGHRRESSASYYANGTMQVLSKNQSIESSKPYSHRSRISKFSNDRSSMNRAVRGEMAMDAESAAHKINQQRWKTRRKLANI